MNDAQIAKACYYYARARSATANQLSRYVANVWINVRYVKYLIDKFDTRAIIVDTTYQDLSQLLGLAVDGVRLDNALLTGLQQYSDLSEPALLNESEIFATLASEDTLQVDLYSAFRKILQNIFLEIGAQFPLRAYLQARNLSVNSTVSERYYLHDLLLDALTVESLVGRALTIVQYALAVIDHYES